MAGRVRSDSVFIRGVSIGFLKTRSAMDEYNLPESYGKTRLVVLAVDPYLIHAYWEIAPPELDEASRHAGKSKAVLRFTKGTNQDDHADWFNVDIKPICMLILVGPLGEPEHSFGLSGRSEEHTSELQSPDQ